MGLDKSEQEKRELVINQISFGGFDGTVSAKMLSEFLEREVGLVWRCRLKNSWTPPSMFPNFDYVNTSQIQKMTGYQKVEPHAFVHFVSPNAAKMAINLAGCSKLVFNGRPLKANSGMDSSHRVATRKKTYPFTFSNVTVEIGSLPIRKEIRPMIRREEFWVGWKGPDSGVDFQVDPFDGHCRILFSSDTVFSDKDINRHTLIKCDFKVEFLVRAINWVRLYKETLQLVMVLQLASSPLIYYRTADDDIYNQASFPLLDDEDPWIRTTDFTTSGAIGRCDTYRILFSPRFGPTLEKVKAYFKELRIFVEQPNFNLIVQDEPGFGNRMDGHFFSVQNRKGISFKVMFLVNSLVHKGIVNQHQLSVEFFGLLRGQPETVNIAALQYIYSCKSPTDDAYEKLKTVLDWLLKNSKLLKSSSISENYAEVRRLVITPTRAYCLPPDIERSNRVLRKYQKDADRFLRVTFMDEGFQQLQFNAFSSYAAFIVKDITMKSVSHKTNIFKRSRSILFDGFYLCGRKYSFLAFSPNQLKDRSAWFFADNKETTAESIRKWMGKFDNRNVAKCAARMGQCFSSTYATVDVPPEQATEILDIERNGYCFSDGMGKITPELALEIAEKLQLTGDPPSAYQIRYAGCKGVLACWPGKGHVKIRLSWRKSMSKFFSRHTTVEVASWTHFQPGFLNRQIITLLSCLGVHDDIFSRMQDAMVSKLDHMLENTDMAFEVLTTSCGEQGNTAAIMLSAGFKPQAEPHLMGMLYCIRLAQLGGLLSKTRIFVPQSRWLMGCFDEIGELEQGQCFIQVSRPSLESCFYKHGSRFSGIKKSIEVITGIVAVAKNPCLHPGDIRILEAVDAPGLHHLVDCLVFPQKGDRPHPNEASGSDLDGDIYFVSWDENLLPPSRKSSMPMDYAPAEAKAWPRPVTVKDIIEFFTRNMVTENLGKICNAHVVHADLCKAGAMDEKCLRLAELAALAVDFPKTGMMVTMDPYLKPKIYPDFMEKDDCMSYKSDKILGRLYRTIKNHSQDGQTPEINEQVSDEIPYDCDLEVPGLEDFISDAWDNKCTYDRQLNALLGLYKVKTETEVVTGHFWSLPKFKSRQQGQIKDKLDHAYKALNKEFRCTFENLDSGSQLLTDDQRNVLYEHKASAWYVVTYHPQWINKAMELRVPDQDAKPVRLSFAWVAADYLARIKIRKRGQEGIDAGKPIDALAGFLANKM